MGMHILSCIWYFTRALMCCYNFVQISVTALKFLLDKDEDADSESESEVHHY